jgi:hypothetical protein
MGMGTKDYFGGRILLCYAILIFAILVKEKKRVMI